MRNNKIPLNILFRKETADLMTKWYNIDYPNKERSFSEWLDAQLKARLLEREVLG